MMPRPGVMAPLPWQIPMTREERGHHATRPPACRLCRRRAGARVSHWQTTEPGASQ